MVSEAIQLGSNATHVLPYCHESLIAQWLEHPTGTWKVVGSTPVGRTQNVFFLSIPLKSVISFFSFTSKSPFHL